MTGPPRSPDGTTRSGSPADSGLWPDDDVDTRGISTPVGAVLMVAIVVALSVVVAGAVLGVGGERSSEAPAASVDIRTLDGGDGTLSDSGDGGLCSSDPEGYADDDGLRIRHESGDSIQWENMALVVDGTEATLPNSCSAMGATTLDIVGKSLADGGDTFAAGSTVTIREGKANNAIQSGATVMLVWDNPDSSSQTVVAERQIP